MNKFRHLFPQSLSRLVVIGMIHVKSLPGTPNAQHSVSDLVNKACEEAEIYRRHNIDGVCVENMHDVPYVTKKDAGPEITAVMTRICSEVKRIVGDIPCGVQLLASLNQEALSTALAADLQFIRAEAFVYGHVADEGLMNACAGPLLRYRRLIGADNILIFADIKKKHSSHAITSDIDIVETSKAAHFFLSDALIVTGCATGDPPSFADVLNVKSSVDLPLILGSGVTNVNIEEFFRHKADAAIIGSHFKHNGFWRNEINEYKIAELMEIAASCTRENLNR